MLVTPRLILRPPHEDDIQRFFDIYSDPHTNLYNPFGPYKNIEMARTAVASSIEHWGRYGFGLWAVATQDKPELVIGFGGVSFRSYINEEKLNLGYRFAPEAWGYGYATEVGQAALRRAFDDHEQNEVFAIVRPSNIPSIRVLEKLSMNLVGELNDVPGQCPSLLYNVNKAG